MPSTSIREAAAGDVEAMVALSEAKRSAYEQFQPVFWRKAADSAERQTAFFQFLIQQPKIIALVAEEDDVVAGFLIAAVKEAPPVYDPGGLTCLVDDFVVRDADRWIELGGALLDALSSRAQPRGAIQLVIVCGWHDEGKQTLMKSRNLDIASDWYVGPI